MSSFRFSTSDLSRGRLPWAGTINSRRDPEPGCVNVRGPKCSQLPIVKSEITILYSRKVVVIIRLAGGIWPSTVDLCVGTTFCAD
jgi:hypothetical protein